MTEEYLELLEKYNKTLSILKKKTRQHNDTPEQIVVGKHMSAHAHSIRPITTGNMGNTDNEIVEEMLK